MILHNIDISVQVRENWVLFSIGFQRLSEIILRYEGAQGVDQRAHGRKKKKKKKKKKRRTHVKR